MYSQVFALSDILPVISIKETTKFLLTFLGLDGLFAICLFVGRYFRSEGQCAALEILLEYHKLIAETCYPHL